MENKIDMSGNVNFIGTQEEWDALVEKNKLRLSAMKKQTAVEWLYERLERMIPREALYNMDKKQYFEQAKAMEKEQIIDAFEEGENNSIDYFVPENRIKESEQYYNEIYL